MRTQEGKKKNTRKE